MRKERGSITIIVFATVTFILIVLATTFTTMTYKSKSQIIEFEDLKEVLSMEGEEKIAQTLKDVSLNKGILEGSGTKADAYKIYTIEDLLRFSNRTNAGDSFNGKFIELMNDLDFNQDGSYENPSRIDYGDVNGNGTIEPLKTELTTGKGWPAIGTEENPFKGTFDGKDNEIKNLYINTNEENKGFFGICNTCTLKNFEIGGTITADAKSIGGIVCKLINSNSRVINCINRIDINHTHTTSDECFAGGIASNFSGIISVCKNYGSIVSVTLGRNMVGGIAGKADGAMEKCENFGNISSESSGNSYTDIGGIAGRTSILIDKCFNVGRIEGKSCSQPLIGGIAGVNYYAVVSNCYNTGVIVAKKDTEFCGGIVGDNFFDSAITKNCYSIGNVVNLNNENIGKIVGGQVGGAKIQYCFAIDSYISITKGSNNITNSELKPAADMKLQSFVDLLNTNQTEVPWQMDTTNINNGYPILKWQVE